MRCTCSISAGWHHSTDQLLWRLHSAWLRVPEGNRRDVDAGCSPGLLLAVIAVLSPLLDWAKP